MYTGNAVSEKNSSRRLGEQGREGGAAGVTTPQPHRRSARASTSYGLYEPSLTSTISSATLPCASRWTASAASLFLGKPTLLLEQHRGLARCRDDPHPIGHHPPPVDEFEGGVVGLGVLLVGHYRQILGVAD